MAEHAYNNSVTSATGMTPFYANYGRHPKTLNLQRTEVMNPAAHAYAHWIKGSFEKGKIVLDAARKRMSENTDNRRIPPPAYKIGDPVMLSTRHIKTKKPSGKLDHKYLGPFQIDNHLAHHGTTDTTTKMENTSFIPCIRTRTIHIWKPPSTQYHQSSSGSERY